MVRRRGRRWSIVPDGAFPAGGGSAGGGRGGRPGSGRPAGHGDRVQAKDQLRRQATSQRPPLSARHKGQNRDPARPHSTRLFTRRCRGRMSTACPSKGCKVIAASTPAATPVTSVMDASSSRVRRMVQAGSTSADMAVSRLGRPSAPSTSVNGQVRRAAMNSSQESRASPGSGAHRIGKLRRPVLIRRPGPCADGWWPCPPEARIRFHGGPVRRLRRS